MKLIIYNPDHHYSYIQACVISQTLLEINPLKTILISCFNETEIINIINKNRINIIIQIVYGKCNNYLSMLDNALKIIIINSSLYNFNICKDMVVLTKNIDFHNGIIFDLFSTSIDIMDEQLNDKNNFICKNSYYWIGVVMNEYDGYDLVKKFEIDNNVIVNKINLHDEKDSVIINSIINKLMSKCNVTMLINRNDNYAIKYYCIINKYFNRNIRYIILDPYDRIDSLFVEDYVVEKILELI